MNHRLSVVNQKMEDKSVTKESQNRYSKSAKDWGWREFVTLTSLFDQDSGFLVHDVVVFSAEVLIMKETSIMHEFTDKESEFSTTGVLTDKINKMSSFTWKVENFLSFKDIMETRKIFSRFFQAGGCELRLGESFSEFSSVYQMLKYNLYTGYKSMTILILLLQAFTSHLTQYAYT